MRSTDGFRTAEDLYLRALAEPGLEIRQKVNILCELAVLADARGDSREGAQYAEVGLALAEQLAEPELLAVSLATVAEITSGSPAASGETCSTARSRSSATVPQRRLVLPRRGSRSTLAWLLGRSDRYEEARAIWSDLIAEAYERADPAVVAHLVVLACMEVAAGAWDEAARLCDEAMETARETGWETVERCVCTILAEIDGYRGEAEKARREIPDLLRVAERAGYGGAMHRLARSLALLELSCGDAAASWRQVEPRFADLEELDESLARLAGSVAIEALIAIGDLLTAERLLMLLDEHATEAETAVRPLAHRCRGLLQAAQGDHERRDRHARSGSRGAGAAAERESVRARPDAARARNGAAQGAAQARRARVPATGRRDLRAARRTHLAGEARSELARIGGRVAHEGELSETERRIVELVVAGRRNREVAAELSLSPNTVAWNLPRSTASSASARARSSRPRWPQPRSA